MRRTLLSGVSTLRPFPLRPRLARLSPAGEYENVDVQRRSWTTWLLWPSLPRAVPDLVAIKGNVNAAKVSSAIQVVRAREGTTRRGMDCCKRCLSRFQVWTTATSRLTRCWPLSEPISSNNEPDERVRHAKGCERSWPISPTESTAPLRYRALASLRLVG